MPATDDDPPSDPESHNITETLDGSCVFVARPGWVPDTIHLRPVSNGGDPPVYTVEAKLVGCNKRTASGRAAQVSRLVDLRDDYPRATWKAFQC